MQSSARAWAPASRKRASKPRIDVEPPVIMKVDRLAISRIAQPPAPCRKEGSISFAASSITKVLA